MNENNDFELVPSTRAVPSLQPQAPGPAIISPGVDKLAGVAADHFGRILDAACAITEIQQMKVQADICVAQLREQRLMLAEEAKAYVSKIEAETDRTVQKVEVIRRMMQDYYRCGQDKLSSEAFSKIVSDVLDRIGEF
ncbi:MAG: hypothetical protein HDT38_01095 [Clostridiales bacterium]|nr:hypothetical protein [Clostridiales bacterium]